jgi:hypothetical protein
VDGGVLHYNPHGVDTSVFHLSCFFSSTLAWHKRLNDTGLIHYVFMFTNKKKDREMETNRWSMVHGWALGSD